LDTQAFAVGIALLMRDLKCEEVVVLNVQGLSQVTRYVIIGSGTSDRQMGTVGNQVIEYADEAGHPVFRVSPERSSSWIVVDFVDVIVHLFEPNTRAFYDLESLWIDAQRVPWRHQISDSSNSQPPPS
jgi:ribosome-associated protein